MNRPPGFTLIEVIVVVTIVVLLLTMLIPSLTSARDVARIAICGSNLRQQAQFTTMYGIDCKGNLPMPTTSHRLKEANNAAATRYDIYPNNIIDMFTRQNAGLTCPLSLVSGASNTPNIQPVGYGWFYWQGYVLPYTNPKPGSILGKVRKPTGIFDCPSTPNYTFKTYATTIMTFGETPIEWVEDWVNQYSNATNLLANHDIYNTANNPGGVASSYDCYPQEYEGLGYMNRGWALDSLTTWRNRVSDWKPGNAWAIDSQHWLAGGVTPDPSNYDIGYPRKHSNGLNVMFIDGRVTFGGRDGGINLGGVNRQVPYSVWLAATYGFSGSGTTLNNAYQYASSGMLGA